MKTLIKYLKYVAIGGISVYSSFYSAFAQQLVKPGLSEKRIEIIISIIERIENSHKYPYGVKSVKLKGKTYKEKKIYAKNICRESIINNYNRWIKEDNSEPFYIFLANHYCTNADPKGLRNWKKNFQYFAKKQAVLF